MSTRTVTDRERVIAFLAGAASFLSILEYAIPRPVPFFRLGLSHLPVLFAVRILRVREVLLLVCFKVFVMSLLQGTLISYVFAFSLLGSFASAGAMLLVNQLLKRNITYIGMSVMGALASTLVQIVLARFIVFGKSAWLIAPPLILLGIITSVLLGAFSNTFEKKSQWLRMVKARIGVDEVAGMETRK